MNENKNSYKQILKATTLFGGVQVYNILLSVIKTKIVAVLIGANGLGVLGLFNSSIRLIVDVTKVGLDTSAVKELSELNSNAESCEISDFISVLNKVIWITGVLGAFLVVCFSKPLSVWTFGSDKYTIHFTWLAIAIIFNQLTKGKIAIFQGNHQLKKLAKANLMGSSLALLISLPIYFYFRMDGIVPAIIGSFVITYLVFLRYSNTKKTKTIKHSLSEIYQKSKAMFSLGLTMSFTSIVGALTLWLIQIYIRNQGGVEAVGFYSAGLVIINSYVGMVFSAMSTDYFPRLSAINRDKVAVNEVVNKQANIAVLIITPIILLFLTFDFLIIRILYTKEFLVILGLVTFGVLGTLFKAVSFSIGYVIIAKGDSRIFIKTSLFFNAILFLICALSYHYGGLKGLGIGLLLHYFIHFTVLKILTHYLYGLTLNRAFYKVFVLCVFLCFIGFLGTLVGQKYIRFLVMVLIVSISVIFTLREFNKQIDLKEIMHKFLKQNKEK
ncbi:O-antigen/teichoic acid export membrane protein [Seonamhaeicola aphaedonensis]|uniref:O-antigen/teichoic acid export membrane protein n=1 Tax=Seonamhaeicola aphaedonensis TaxID=1461338 RepID=A0A3D9HHL2_9FLAO|nr:O-antigen/teichoic acid export membrane protein [Seonamhaeicola aphaedonensis]